MRNLGVPADPVQVVSICSQCMEVDALTGRVDRMLREGVRGVEMSSGVNGRCGKSLGGWNARAATIGPVKRGNEQPTERARMCFELPFNITVKTLMH